MNFNLTRNQLYALAAALGVGMLWLLNRKPTPARVSRTATIDANVLSPTFGEVIDDGSNNPARDPTMRALIDESNAAIAAHPDQGDVL